MNVPHAPEHESTPEVATVTSSEPGGTAPPPPPVPPVPTTAAVAPVPPVPPVPAAGAPVAGAAVTAPAVAPSAFAVQLRTLVAGGGIASAALSASAVLTVALVSAALILTVVAVSSRSSLDVGTGILALLVGAGWMLGTGVSGAVQGAALFGQQVDAGASIGALALGTLAAVVILLSVLARVRSAVDGSAAGPFVATLARTAIESVAIALALTLLTSIPAVTLGSGGTTLVLRSNGFGTFAVSAVTIAAGLLIGRARGRLRPGPMAGFSAAIREAGTMLLFGAAVFAAVAIVAGIGAAATQNQPLIAVGLLPFLGNAAGFLAALAALGGITSSSSLGSSNILSAGDLLNGWGWLLPVAGLLLLIVLAIRIGAHRGACTTVRWNRVWQLPVVAFAMWLLLALVLMISAGAGVIVLSGGAQIGLAWWTPFLGALWAGALSLCAEVAPRFAAELAPPLFGVLAGVRGREAWAAGVPAGAVPAAAATPVGNVPSGPDASPLLAAAAAHEDDPAPVADGTPPTTAGAAAAPGVSAVSGVATTAAPALSARAKRGFVVGAATVGGLAVLIIAGFVTVGLLNATRGADSAVRDYLTALSDGDASAAAKLVDPGIPNDQRLLLSDDALKHADHRLTVQSVKTLHDGDGSATVEAVLAVDGERFTHTFAVDRGQNEFLVLNTWAVKDPLLTEIQVGADASDTLLLGDIKVPLGSTSGYADGPSGTVWVYPGTYSFSAPESTYVTSTKATIRVTDKASSGRASAFVTQSPSTALKDFVLKQAQDRITACATVPTNVDKICPYPANSTTLAALSLKAQATKLTDITLQDFRTDDATITTQGNTTFGYTPSPRDTSFSLHGKITFTDGKPEVTFTSAY